MPDFSFDPVSKESDKMSCAQKSEALRSATSETMTYLLTTVVTNNIAHRAPARPAVHKVL